MANPNLNTFIDASKAPVPPESIDKAIADTTMKAQQIAQKRDAEIAATAPVGKFSKGALDRFVKIINKAASLFGVEQEVAAPKEDQTTFAPDLNTPFQMIVAAINDAASDMVIDTELAITPKELVDDASLRTVGAKIMTATSDKAFQKWLREPSPEMEKEEPENEAPENEVSEAKSGSESGEHMMPDGTMMKGSKMGGMEKMTSPPQGNIMDLFARRA